MANSWFERIDKLFYWQANNWVRCNMRGLNELLLRVHYDQLMIVADTKVIESISLTSKIKGIYKEDFLILLICETGKETRKIRFQIVSNASRTFERLGHNFPVINHNSAQKISSIKPKFAKINDVLKKAIENKEILTSVHPSPVREDFVKICLLDPTFPQTVLEIKNILDLINQSE